MTDMNKEIIEFVRAAHGDKQIAFAVAHYGAGLWVLSVVRKDEEGKYPLSSDWAVGPRADMDRLSDQLNDELGLTQTQAMLYIASSMEGSRQRAGRVGF